jgi:hypothetical protein
MKLSSNRNNATMNKKKEKKPITPHKMRKKRFFSYQNPFLAKTKGFLQGLQA